MDKSITELQKLKIKTNSTNEERLQQFRILKASLEDLHHEIQDIKAQVVDHERYGIRRGLKEDELDLLTARTASLSFSEQNFAKEEAVLSSLNFPQRSDDTKPFLKHTKTPSDGFLTTLNNQRIHQSLDFVNGSERVVSCSGSLVGQVLESLHS